MRSVMARAVPSIDARRARARDADATSSTTRASLSSIDARAIVDGAEGVLGPPERERDGDG